MRPGYVNHMRNVYFIVAAFTSPRNVQDYETAILYIQNINLVILSVWKEKYKKTAKLFGEALP